MPTAAEELVDFLPHGNAKIRQLVVESLLPYSCSQPLIFKKNQLLPVKNLMLLARDYKQIAHHALTILINLSTDHEILEVLCSDNGFLENIIGRLSSCEESNTHEISMLLANLGKSDDFKKLILTELLLHKEKRFTRKCIDNLIDLFVKSIDGSSNVNMNYDYLSYLFADTAMLLEGRKHMLTKQKYDQIFPLSKLIVFTSHKSQIRRQGIASTIKNVCFEIGFHSTLLCSGEDGIDLLPYLFLPLMGSEEYDAEDSEGMLDECQLLPTTKERESDLGILRTHLDALLLLTTTRKCREHLRKVKLYPIIRELHRAAADDDVKEACNRLVQVLMRDEEDINQCSKKRIQSTESESLEQIEEDDEKVVEI